MIGIPDYHSFDAISQLLKSFAQAFPEIAFETLEMTAMAMQQALLDNKIDIGFLAQPFPIKAQAGLASISIDVQPYQVCVSSEHPFADADVLGPEQLEGTELILLAKSAHPSFHQYVVDGFVQMGHQPVISEANATGLSAQYSLVAANMGMCMVLPSSPVPSSQLVVKRLTPQILHHDLNLVWQQSNQRQWVQCFIDMARTD